MAKLAEWVKEVRKEKCEDCSSKEDLKVLRSGRTLCLLCFYKHHNKNRKVSGKRPPKPLTRNSHRDKLWEEIESLRSQVEALTRPQTNGEETRDLQEDFK